MLSRFEAVPADRSDNGICGVFGVSSSEEVRHHGRAWSMPARVTVLTSSIHLTDRRH